jgi:hypothetical protein
MYYLSLFHREKDLLNSEVFVHIGARLFGDDADSAHLRRAFLHS